MRKLIIWNLMTLDGYFEGTSPWALDFHEYAWGDEMRDFSLEQGHAADTLLFGRRTYQGMAAYWATEEGEIADMMSSIRKVVFSSTLDRADWNNTELVRGNAAAEVARLKSLPGRDILVFGSSELCDALLRAGLVDEYRIGLAPVVLGGGNPLFKPAPEPLGMSLIGVRPLQTGCVILSYRPGTAGGSAPS
jgi:dihydrofolate reductase